MKIALKAHPKLDRLSDDVHENLHAAPLDVRARRTQNMKLSKMTK